MQINPNKKLVKLGSLVPHPKNPRKIEDKNLDALGKSILKFGCVQPIIVNKNSGYVVSGHQRLEILRENFSASEEIEIVVVDLSESEEKALMVALNSPNLQGFYSDQVDSILDQIKNDRPDLWNELRLGDLENEKTISEIKKMDSGLNAEKIKFPQNMEIIPYEHWDYLLIMSERVEDWHWLCEYFGLQPNNGRPLDSRKKIGIGRAIKAEKFIAITKERTTNV